MRRDGGEREDGLQRKVEREDARLEQGELRLGQDFEGYGAADEGLSRGVSGVRWISRGESQCVTWKTVVPRRVP